MKGRRTKNTSLNLPVYPTFQADKRDFYLDNFHYYWIRRLCYNVSYCRSAGTISTLGITEAIWSFPRTAKIGRPRNSKAVVDEQIIHLHLTSSTMCKKWIGWYF